MTDKYDRYYFPAAYRKNELNNSGMGLKSYRNNISMNIRELHKNYCLERQNARDTIEAYLFDIVDSDILSDNILDKNCVELLDLSEDEIRYLHNKIAYYMDNELSYVVYQVLDCGIHREDIKEAIEKYMTCYREAKTLEDNYIDIIQ